MDNLWRELVMGIFNSFVFYTVIATMGGSVYFFSRIGKTYREYLNYMKTYHDCSLTKIRQKDQLVDTVGKWIAWPVGSPYPLLSLFNVRDTYNDEKVLVYKKRALMFLSLTLFFFIFSLLITIMIVNRPI
jgi:hypothetical protein